MTKRLILARHAQVDPQYTGRFLGSTDAPLSQLGMRQAGALAQSLPLDQSTPLFVSPMRRAIETAEHLDHNAETDPDLREIDFGQWEGRSFDEIRASDKDNKIDGWSNFDPEFSFPDGESLGAFVARIARAADRLASNTSDTVVVITHGGVIRTMICHLLGLDPRNYLLFDVKPASITTLDLFDSAGIDARGVLTGLGDTCHLKGVR
jgi:alpha-ribazole phosphatase